MKILPFESSSYGNCTIIFTNSTLILLDAGIPLKNIIKQLNGKKPDALIISHNHSDHIKSAGAIGRKYKCPIYMHPKVKEAIESKLNKCNVVDMNPASKITIGDIEIVPFSTKHDAIYTYGFNITDTNNNKTLSFVTDTGIVTPLMLSFMKKANALFIESDYDDKLLMEYPEYTEMLKERINSSFGHLSNSDAISTIKKLNIDNLEFVIFGHLSIRTNSPELVKTAAITEFPNYNSEKIYVAPLTEELEL